MLYGIPFRRLGTPLLDQMNELIRQCKVYTQLYSIQHELKQIITQASELEDNKVQLLVEARKGRDAQIPSRRRLL